MQAARPGAAPAEQPLLLVRVAGSRCLASNRMPTAAPFPASPALPQGRGAILALDIGRSRLAALRRMADRQAHGSIVRTLAADLRDFASQAARQRRQAAGEQGGAAVAEGAAAAAERGRQAAQWPTQFDRVLLDAPCSGTGVLAKRADLRWRKSEADVRQMAALQGELLAAAAGACRWAACMGGWGGCLGQLWQRLFA